MNQVIRKHFMPYMNNKCVGQHAHLRIRICTFVQSPLFLYSKFHDRLTGLCRVSLTMSDASMTPLLVTKIMLHIAGN